MLDRDVGTPEAALVYITDCNLATVDYMATLKNRPKYEFKRQIDIAQKAIWWMQAFKVDFSTTRAQDIADKYVNASVQDWANDIIKSIHG